MKSGASTIGRAAFLSALLFAPGSHSQELSHRAEQVIEYLLEDWSEHMHSTDIALAMENLNMVPDDDLRMEVGEHFRANTHLASNLKWWGANNYILSSEEKLIAKYILNAYEKEERIVSLSELADGLEMPAERLGERLAFMARAGLLKSDSATPLGYDLPPKYARWGGPLRYNFHNVTIGDGKPFGVW